MESRREKFARKLRRSIRRRLGRPSAEGPENPEAWPPLPPAARAILEALYAGQPVPGRDGELHVPGGIARIGPAQGRTLYELHSRLRPELSVEVGLAYGYSTLYMLSAMRNGGYGRHLAMDPTQSTTWHGIGMQHAERLGMSDRFEFEEAPSIQVLPRLIAEGAEAQLVFIDGNHQFESALVDFHLAAAIVPVGGVIVFDDVWMPSVDKVTRYIRSNRRDFTEQDAGHRHFATFERVGLDERAWDHFVNF